MFRRGAEPSRSGGRRAGGVTLLETLFASALGALLLVALLNLYQRAIARHAFAESRAALTETLFTAERILSQRLHLAGGLPCGRGGEHFNLIRAAQTTPWLRLFTEPVQIAAVGDGDELVALTVGAPVPLASHDPVRAQFALTDAAGFERGDLIVVCDAAISVLLQVTRTADGGRVLGYAHDARVRPGNCALPFSSCGPENYRFADDALVAPYEPVVFFIRDAGTRRALYRKRLTLSNTAGGVSARLLSEELIDGVSLLRVWAGVADTAGRIRLRRDSPGAGRTVLLDIGLVALARGRDTDTADEPAYLFGEPADVAAAGRPVASHEFGVAW